MADDMMVRVKWEDDEGEEHLNELPGKYEVCDRCRGKGVHDHEAFNNGISMQDFHEDPDFHRDYMKGRYDVTCSVCNGKRVVLVPDEDSLDEDQKKILEQYYNNLRWEAEYRAECDAERRMGA